MSDGDGAAAAAAPPPEQQPGWYYADAARGPIGPYAEPQFAALARAGAMPLATPVWRPGLDWAPLHAHATLLGIPPSTLRQLAKAQAGGSGGNEQAARPQQHDADAPAGGAPPAPPSPPSPPPEERRFVEGGSTFEWDSQLRRFVEVEGDGEGGGPARGGRKQQRSAAQVLERRAGGRGGGGGGGGLKGAPPPPPATGTAAAPPTAPARPPTAVYVTGLPPDTDEAEVAAVFGKCGLVRPARSDPTGRTPAVRLYRHPDTGRLKGDGTVHFLKPPSVDLALTLLDGVPLRAGGSPAMRVAVAQFEARGGGGEEAGGGGAGQADAVPPPPAKRARPGGGGGRGRGRGGPPAPANPAAARAAAALAWDGFDDEAPPADTTVVLTGGYDLDAALAGGGDAAEAAVAALCTRALARSAAATAGVPGGAAVEAVRLFLGEPGALATIRFRTPAAAAVAVSRLAGRPGPVRGAGAEPMGAELWDGVTEFRARPPKAKKKAKQGGGGGGGGGGAGGAAAAAPGDEVDDEDEEARLAAFGAELFGEDDGCE